MEHYRRISQRSGKSIGKGSAALVAGTVTVNDPRVLPTSRINLYPADGVTNVGLLEVSTRIAGTSFTIVSANALDTRTISWEIIN